MEVNGKPSFVFTPGQREEALSWLANNSDILGMLPNDGMLLDRLIDIHLKMKALAFDIRPEEFLVGIEYKDQKAVQEGKESINIRFNNPRRLNKPHDPFALQVLVSLLNQLTTP